MPIDRTHCLQGAIVLVVALMFWLSLVCPVLGAPAQTSVGVAGRSLHRGGPAAALELGAVGYREGLSNPSALT